MVWLSLSWKLTSPKVNHIQLHKMVIGGHYNAKSLSCSRMKWCINSKSLHASTTIGKGEYMLGIS